MTEETERDPRIMPASNVGEDVEAHYAELDLCEQLEPNEAFAVLKTGKNLKLLREICEDLSTPAKPFVVFEHDEVFEVRRLAKGRSAKRFYAYVGKKDEPGEVEVANPKAQLLQAIADFFERPAEDFKTYEPKFTTEWQSEKAFSYSMISRRAVALSSFRKAKGGGTAFLKTLLTDLVSEGILYEVPEAFAEQHFGTSGKLYRLLK